MKDETSADGLTRVFGIEYIVDFAELKSFDVSVRRVPDRGCFNFAPPVRLVASHDDLGQHGDEVGSTDRPATVTKVASRRRIGRITSWGTVVRPGCDQSDFRVA